MSEKGLGNVASDLSIWFNTLMTAIVNLVLMPVHFFQELFS